MESMKRSPTFLVGTVQPSSHDFFWDRLNSATPASNLLRLIHTEVCLLGRKTFWVSSRNGSSTTLKSAPCNVQFDIPNIEMNAWLFGILTSSSLSELSDVLVNCALGIQRTNRFALAQEHINNRTLQKWGWDTRPEENLLVPDTLRSLQKICFGRMLMPP